ncbi:hypothetical protein [Methylobacterium sp. Leaf118]|uniref:hypothetical protein n=1 Tax=Methylobacterium sp. Leaf118 TaxID=2876562 RepID=UPI001E49C11D|nr:hypothetical protein [Methylobacterium sp. Leaf118]
MISLLFVIAAIGTANVALVAFLADRFGPQAGTLSAGEFAATASTPVSAQSGAVRVGNENVSRTGAKIAA